MAHALLIFRPKSGCECRKFADFHGNALFPVLPIKRLVARTKCLYENGGALVRHQSQQTKQAYKLA